MATTSRTPRVYKRGPWTKLVEGLRYGGGIGQWSWLLHRVTGLGILFFLVIHIIDTFLVVAFPAEYDWTVAIYGGTLSGTYYWPLRVLFRVSELALIATVLFHSLNGVRVVLFDFWPGGAMYQRQFFTAVMVVFWAIMLPLSVYVIYPLTKPPEHMMVVPGVGEGGTMAPITAGDKP